MNRFRNVRFGASSSSTAFTSSRGGAAFLESSSAAEGTSTEQPTKTTKTTKTTNNRQTSSGGTGTQKSIIMALVEGRGLAKGEIGLAAMDLRCPLLTLSQFSDSSSYERLRVKLEIYTPTEIILPDSVLEKGGNMLTMLRTFQEHVPGLKITPMKRAAFNETRGMELLTRIVTQDTGTLEKMVADKYYTVSCAAALIRYVEYLMNIVFARQSVKLEYWCTEDTCMIDIETAKQLELIVNVKDTSDTSRSIHGVLCRTQTAGGSRMIRAALLQPCAKLEEIEKRLDAVTELKSDAPQYRSLCSLLSRMLDVDHLVSLCSHITNDDSTRTKEYKLTQLVYLKHTLELVPALRESLSRYVSQVFQSYVETLEDERFQIILDQINEVFLAETRCEKNALTMLGQKCFAIKNDIDPYLDVNRRTYSELLTDIEEFAKELATETRLPIQCSYTNQRGFYLRMQLKENVPLPAPLTSPLFINVVRKRNVITFTTSDLVRLNGKLYLQVRLDEISKDWSCLLLDRFDLTLDEIFKKSGVIINDLLQKIRDSIVCLYNLTEVVSSVDFLCALTQYCIVSPKNFVRPQFGSSLVISKGRHPLAERYCGQTTYYPNDAHAGAGSNFNIITGPNMSGKSTFLKMVAVLQVMAQMGSYVPARYASFRITDQIFSRIGQNDDLVHNSSAFMVEMKDVNYILECITDRSLVIIDELGRGTSPEEGLSICHAVCEQLLNTDAFVFIATHFLELARLDGLYPNVENYHFEGSTSGKNAVSTVVVDHTLKRNAYQGPKYGFELAELSGIPAQVVERAKQLSNAIRQQHNGPSDQDDPARRRERAVVRLGHRLVHAAYIDDMNEDRFRSYMQHLRRRFDDDMDQPFPQTDLSTPSSSSHSSNSTCGSSETPPLLDRTESLSTEP